MTDVIAWCGFLGGWLLVAGPIYQAAIELADEDLDRDELARRVAAVPPAEHVSTWWWLLPPVAYTLRRVRVRRQRHALLAVMSEEQVAGLMHFSETATAWLFVASGAFLLAVSETWHLRELYEWPAAVFWVLVVVLAGACAANTVARIRRRREILSRAQSGTAGARTVNDPP